MWDLSTLTPRQKEITEQALARCAFDWEKLRPGLKAQTGKNAIPVEWADLARYRAKSVERSSKIDLLDQHEGHDHYHVQDLETGDKAHVLATRKRALGLAWYSGKVSIDSSLESDPELAIEVFLSEGAHMIDFFWMTDEQRQEIFRYYHGGSDAEHGHTWFDNPSYWEDTGESFMAGFVSAFSNVKPTIGAFTHVTTPEIAAKIRILLQPPPANPVISTRKSRVFHKRKHWWIVGEVVSFPSREDAIASGRRSCLVCKP